MRDSFDYAISCDTYHITVVLRWCYIIEFGLCSNSICCAIADTPDISPAGEIFDAPKNYNLCAFKRNR